MKRAAGGQSVKSFQLISASIYHPHSVVFKWISAGVLMTVFHDCSCIISQWQKSGNYIFTTPPHPPPPPLTLRFSVAKELLKELLFYCLHKRHAKERWYEQLIWLRYSCWFIHSFSSCSPQLILFPFLPLSLSHTHITVDEMQKRNYSITLLGLNIYSTLRSRLRYLYKDHLKASPNGIQLWWLLF